jgi:hypothetical protein
VWLDSGAAIARRVAHVLMVQPGAAHARNLGFTDMAHAHGLAPALQERGFAGVHRIGPDFGVTPYT